ncbi:MAG TPA: lipocalin family protein [Flavobacteriaceae bacterium]|nr:lipocalin family protein [Flavobacteriaceae bacterium]
MKILIFSLLLLMSSCDKGDDTKSTDSIIGTWKLVEVYGSDGGSNAQWTPIDNGYTYTFRNDGVLISDRFSCNGTFEQSSEQLTINFDCVDNQFNLTYNMSLMNNELVLTADSMNCDEGCAEKYQRIMTE